MTKTHTGGCACGAIRYDVSGDPVFQNHCQCLDCQKQSGTGHGSYLSFLSRSEAKVVGQPTEWRVTADSGNDKLFAFCPTCGSSLYVTFAAMPELIAVAATSLDDPGRFKPQALTYNGRGHAWDLVDPALTHFEHMPA